MGILAGMYHEMATAPDVGDWLGDAEAEPLDEMQALAIREFRRVYTNMTCLSSEFVRKQVNARIRAEQLWRELRPTGDWTTFLPALRGPRRHRPRGRRNCAPTCWGSRPMTR